jgi:hypothetical protein
MFLAKKFKIFQCLMVLFSLRKAIIFLKHICKILENKDSIIFCFQIIQQVNQIIICVFFIKKNLD